MSFSRVIRTSVATVVAAGCLVLGTAVAAGAQPGLDPSPRPPEYTEKSAQPASTDGLLCGAGALLLGLAAVVTVRGLRHPIAD